MPDILLVLLKSQNQKAAWEYTKNIVLLVEASLLKALIVILKGLSTPSGSDSGSVSDIA